MNKLYVQYGGGYCAPQGWLHFEASPALRLQKIPLIGTLFIRHEYGPFPKHIQFGNIIQGLPGIENNSCDGIYCSHVLEHLALEDFRKALKNTYNMLKPGGIFRMVLPDLEWAARNYVKRLDQQDSNASIDFCGSFTYLGREARPKGLKGLLITFLGNSSHLWMWDRYSLKKELETIGFISIRNCEFNDCDDTMFQLLEDKGRFFEQKGNETVPAIAIECRK